MSIRNMIIMVILCLGLGTFWYVYDYKGEPERQEAKAREERLFPDLKAEDVCGLHWTEPAVGQESERQLALKDGLWMLQDGAKQVYAAQQETADTAKQVAELKRVSVIKEQPQKAEYADFGLDKPEFELAVASKGQKGEQTLLIGAETPAGDARYMQIKGQAPILEVAGTFMDFLRNKAVDMREKTLLVVSPEKISNISFEEPGRDALVMSKLKTATEAKEGEEDTPVEATTADATWTIDSPQKCKADLNAVNDFLWQLHSFTVSQFLPPVESDLLRYRLANVAFTIDGGPTLHAEIWDDDLGHSNDGSMVIHRLDTDEYMIAQLSVEREKVYGLGVDDFVDRHMVACQVDDVDRLEVNIPARAGEKSSAAQVLEARRDGDGWKISKPASTITDANSRDAAVYEIVYALTDMQWSKKDKQGGGKVDTGCPTMVAYDKDGQVLARLSVGAKGEKGYPVQLEGSPALYWLESDPSQDWARSIASLIPDEMKHTPSPVATASAAGSPAPDASPEAGK